MSPAPINPPLYRAIIKDGARSHPPDGTTARAGMNAPTSFIAANITGEFFDGELHGTKRHRNGTETAPKRHGSEKREKEMEPDGDKRNVIDRILFINIICV